MMFLAILVTGFFLQQPQPASIEGTVLGIGTTQPIARAVVQAVGAGSEPYTVETSADGSFRFTNLPRGQYEIRASRTGYMDGVFGGRGPNSRGVSLSVDAGQVVRDVRITMVPLAAMSGRVFDDRGEPLANVNVQALKYADQTGQTTLKVMKSGLTNDRGEYRLFWLPPGKYYVRAIASTSKVYSMLQVVLAETPTGPATIEGIMRGSSKPSEAYAPVYYPGTPDTQSANPIQLRPGADLGGLDFGLLRVQPRKVRGTVINGA